ncbi:MAG: GNAT family N-acetyltransferase [Anaerolineales bacterium]
MTPPELIIRQANVEDADTLRELRLEALQNRPIAFASDYEEESQYPVSRTEERLKDQSLNATFIAIANSKLVGMTGVSQYNHRNVKHNGIIWGVYVQPAWRGKNISGQLIEACATWARERSIKFIKLGVESRNTSAIHSYLRAGFKVYGVESQVIFYEGKYYDELLMVREI